MIVCLTTYFDGWIVLKNRNDPYLALERRIWLLIGIVCATVLLLSVTGCSPTTQIAKASTGITEAAVSSKNRFAIIYDESQAQAPDIVLIAGEAQGGLGDQDRILSYATKIQHALPSVEDEMPYWMSFIQYGVIVAGILGVAWILWYTGIGSLIKRLIGFIPKAKKREANLAAAVMNDASPATMREFIAARRASDPEFDKAYERASTQRNTSVCKDGRPPTGV